jgi:hypothetical protein
MMNCTWVDCKKTAKVPEVASDGEVWANLCDEHHNELEEAIGCLEPKKLLRAWVRASGGAKKMASRF